MRATPAILFDATRLLRRKNAGTPTGIDRVVFEHARWLLRTAPEALVPVWNWRGRLSRIDTKKFSSYLSSVQKNWDDDIKGASSRRLDRIVQRIDADNETNGAVREPRPLAPRNNAGWLGRFAESRKAFRYDPGSIYLSSAHSGLEVSGLLSSLKAGGAAAVVFIHDLIPITHPEFCRAGEKERHERRIRTTLAYAEQIVVNSRVTAHDLSSFAERECLSLPPVAVAPLGVGAAFHACKDAVETRRPYFLAVGTLEGRKNLSFLLMVWRLISDMLGKDAPRLILVGRLGWESESIIDLLDRSEHLKDTVIEIAGLADKELAVLLAGANGLLAPSFAEGFNLPVAEALALGVPVIASDIPAHRELLAGRHQLLHPLDGPGWLSAIVKAAESRQKLSPDRVSLWTSHLDILDGVIKQALSSRREGAS